MRSRKSRRRPSRGFTLMEVLLVLAILVILGSLVVAFYPRVLTRGKISAAKTQIGLFEGMLHTYYLDVGSYPNTNQGLIALRETPADLAVPEKWQGPYAGKDIPPDPWGNPYQYEWIDEYSYHIWSFGPDGQDGTEDDVANIAN